MCSTCCIGMNGVLPSKWSECFLGHGYFYLCLLMAFEVISGVDELFLAGTLTRGQREQRLGRVCTLRGKEGG